MNDEKGTFSTQTVAYLTYVRFELEVPDKVSRQIVHLETWGEMEN